MKNEKTARGGARKGAGRKKLSAEPLKPVMVRLPLSTWEQVLAKGGAAWAREVLIREAKK